MRYRCHLSLLSLLALLVLFSCQATEGELLRSRNADAGIGAPSGDGGPPLPDAAPSADGGEPLSCDMDGPCPAATPGAIALCGRIYDVETSAALSPDDGLEPPEVRVYNVLDLQDSSAQPTPLATVRPDACGWISTVVAAPAVFIALSTGDPQADADAPFRPVSTMVTTTPGQVARVHGYFLRADSERRWSAAVGKPAGTLADEGAIVAIFVDASQPGVSPLSGTPVIDVEAAPTGLGLNASEFYFADPAPLARSDVDATQERTGTNGTAIIIFEQLPLLPSITLGGNRNGCIFSEQVSLARPGTLVVQELVGICN